MNYGVIKLIIFLLLTILFVIGWYIYAKKVIKDID